MLALVGDPEDLGLAYLRMLAGAADADMLWLPESTLGTEWTFDVDDDGSGTIKVGRTRTRVSELTGVVCRLHPEPPVPGKRVLSPLARETLIRERRAAIVHLVDRVRCPVANRPSRGRANASKPLQMMELTAAGFRVPRWVVTNDPSEAKRFARSCPDGAIVKSCSGLRARVRLLDEKTLSRLDASPPTIVQHRIVGDDVRVHVVGSKCFGTKVTTSRGTDYRFDRSRRSYSVVEVPRDIARRCVETRRASELVVAGLDFRVSPTGRWYCLESNPAPSFIAYEMQTGQPIGAAILRALGVSGRALERRRLERQ